MSRRFFQLLSIALIGLVPIDSIATENPPKAKLRKAIESILPAKKAHLKVGILVQSVTSKREVLFEQGGDAELIPASVNKVLTAYAALKRLKPTSTFKTKVLMRGTLRDGKLAGDLYFKGGGDPSLVSERMWMLVNEITRSGVKSIDGNIVADSSYFDTEKTPETRPKYLKDEAYNAPLGALSFNFNTTTIYVRPGEKSGMPPVVYTDPENSYIDVVNQATTGPSGSSNSLLVSRTNYVKGDIGDTVLLRGSIPIDGKELRYYRNIVNPALYTAHMFRTFWEQRGMKLGGNVQEGTAPEEAKQLLEFESLPLWQIVWGMNKFSNNFVADQILKRLGAELYGVPGTLQKGVKAVEDALTEIAIPKNSYRIFDGSGLTRDTRLTPRQIVSVLVAAYNDPAISPEFIASLGVAGEDGTVRSRFPGSEVKGLLRVKTGSLDGVTSLAGLTPSADGEMLAFAILLNDPKQKYGRMTGWADQVALAISRFSRN